jgi:hypothetical protein
MSPDNPYAAPQTIDHATPWAEALPMAVGSERRLYPEISTARLQRLANWSVAIESMSMIWGVVVFFAALAFCMSLGMNRWAWFWGLLMLLAGLRVWGDYRRAPRYWAYNLLLDLLFLGVFVFALIGLARVELLALLVVGVPTLAFGLIAVASVLAHCRARSLYGQYTQRDLLSELRYRKQNRIA